MFARPAVHDFWYHTVRLQDGAVYISHAGVAINLME